MGVDAIFYPCMTYNLDEHLGDNHYNCPVVAYYPEVLAGNCAELREHPVHLRLHRPAQRRKDFMAQGLPMCCMQDFPGSRQRARCTGRFGRRAMRSISATCTHLRARGRARSSPTRQAAGQAHHCARGPALSCRPRGQPRHRQAHHPLRRGGRHRGQRVPADVREVPDGRAQPVDLPRAGSTRRPNIAAEQPDMDLVQLVSLRLRRRRHHHRRGPRDSAGRGASCYTQLKIDEITNLGAVQHPPAQPVCGAGQRGRRKPSERANTTMTSRFTREMKETHTILVPNMAARCSSRSSSRLHGAARGTMCELLAKPAATRSRRLGLKYVHNDTCYPALLVIGQFIDALQQRQVRPGATPR